MYTCIEEKEENKIDLTKTGGTLDCEHLVIEKSAVLLRIRKV